VAATTDREYELVLMLDPEISEERREKIAAEARQRIESQGSLKHDTTWGMRKLAYEIRQRTEADYRLFRFETGGGLLNELDHNLRIADGVLRFRIFKVDPASPTIVPPAPLATGAPAPRSRRGQGPDRGAPPAGEDSEREQPEPAAAADAEPAAESSEGDGAEEAAEPEAAESTPDAPESAAAPDEDDAPAPASQE
jgi:small subunit ribosomal protein S6